MQPLSPAQRHLIAFIAGHPALKRPDLAAAYGLAPEHVTALLDPLLAAGTVQEDPQGRIRAATAATETSSDDAAELLAPFFTQSLDGIFFMMLDQPVRWDDGADKEALLDYVFAHQRLTKVNQAMLTQYGLSEAQMLGLTPADFFGHDLAQGRAVWRRFFDEGRLHVDTQERRADGTPVWIEGDYLCLYDTQGRIRGHFGIQRDVTERKEMETQLAASSQRLQLALEGGGLGTWDWHIPSGEVHFNARWGRMLGFEPEELARHVDTWSARLHPDDRPHVEAALAAHLRGESGYYETEHRMLHRDGHWVWVLDRGMVIERDATGAAVRACGTHLDITARRQADAALIASEARFRGLVEAMDDLVVTFDQEGRYTGLYGRRLEAAGVRPECWIGRRPADLYEPALAAVHERALRSALAGEGVLYEWSEDGRELQTRLSPKRDARGRVIGVVGVGRDITPLKAIEQALETERSRLVSLIANLSGGVLVEDEFRRVVLANRAFCDIFGVPVAPEILVGADCAAAAEQSKPLFADPQGFIGGLERALAARRAETEELTMADGRVLERTYVPIFIGERYRGHLWQYWEITERKRAEEELFRLATTDALTGLPNRRVVMEAAGAELARFRRSGHGAALLLFDVDHFKRVNDGHGHAAGDAVLRALAELLRCSMRTTDRVGRVGGEEFLAVLPDTSLTGACELAERLRAQVAGLSIETGDQRLQITISIGVTAFTPADVEIDAAVSRADRALYAAKESGRNRVVSG